LFQKINHLSDKLWNIYLLP